MRLIDVRDALPKIDEAFLKYAEHDDILRLYSDARLAVINAPTIEAEPVKRGEWVIETLDKQERKIAVTCPECEAFFSLDCFDFGLCYNYCPNCGAKMDGGAEDGS